MQSQQVIIEKLAAANANDDRRAVANKSGSAGSLADRGSEAITTGFAPRSPPSAPRITVPLLGAGAGGGLAAGGAAAAGGVGTSTVGAGPVYASSGLYKKCLYGYVFS